MATTESLLNDGSSFRNFVTLTKSIPIFFGLDCTARQVQILAFVQVGTRDGLRALSTTT